MPSTKPADSLERGRVRSQRSGSRREASRSASRADRVIAQLEAIEARGGDGTVDFGRGQTLDVSSLDKVYFPADGYTKGDIMRYYASVSPVLLPAIADRPSILKRYPDGIDGPSFFQQNVGTHTPDNIRTATLETADGEPADRIIAGDLATLLYTVQIGAIAVHTWQARVDTPHSAVSTTIDLDPGDDVPFTAVVTLAKWIKTELEGAGLRGGLKTSGSRGLHVALPLAPRTPFEIAARISEAIATRIVNKHPELATVARSIKERPPGSIYVDTLQNAEGKSVVSAYSVRERSGAPVSAPLDWHELRSGLRIGLFTIETMRTRIKRIGDPWGAAMKRRNPQSAIRSLLRGS